MKKTVAAYLAATILAVALPAAAVEQAPAADTGCAKECAMQVRNCRQETDTIQSRIERLQREIGKGSAVYTGKELQSLKQRLHDAEETLAYLTRGA